MLRQSQLPPRAPTQRATPAVYQLDEYTSLDHLEESKSHCKSFSQGGSAAPEEEQSEWLNNLLTVLNTSPKRSYPCQSASDSAAVLDNISSPSSGNNDESSASDVSGNVLTGDCIYGPNSPRGKVNSHFLESSMLTALSDYASQIKIPCVEEDGRWSGGTDQFDPEEDGHESTENLSAESVTGKRHPRHRSRARKLQYIAKLEGTVNALQALESELAFKVSALAQQHVNLSVENRSLKQQMTKLRNRKLTMDREYQLLKNEAEILSFRLAKTNSRNTTQLYRLIDAAEDNWDKLDWAKLNL